MRLVFAPWIVVTLFVAFSLLASVAPRSAYPPDSVTGDTDPAITQSNIHKTVCVANYTATVRPPESYTYHLKVKQMRAFGFQGRPSAFEEDHRVPLSVGGSPTSPRNLSPQPWVGPYNAHMKDRLEDAVHHDICSGRLTLAQGRAIFMGDFWAEYKRRFK